MTKDMALATPAQIDRLEREELATLNAITAPRARQRRMNEAAERDRAQRDNEQKQRDKHRKEVNGLVCFVGVMALLCIVVQCVAARAWWPVLLPIGGIGLLMKKAGWI